MTSLYTSKSRIMKSGISFLFAWIVTRNSCKQKNKEDLMEERNICMWNQDEIYAIENALHDNPHHILGLQEKEGQVFVNAYFPNAIGMKCISRVTKKEERMTPVDGYGFYSTLWEKDDPYLLEVAFENNTTYQYVDAYSFSPVITKEDIAKFQEGYHYEIYRLLGAHKRSINGISGVLFAVWAPNAGRVSVVGDFNLWDGRRHPMRKLENSGIFELFIPDVQEGALYKFEIRARNGDVFLKADPYGNYAQLRPETASVVADLSGFEWNDKQWLKERKKADTTKLPMSIYEVHLGAWKKPEDGREFYNYREIAPMLASYVKEMEYTHIEIMPIMEHPYDPSWGYQVTGYFAPTARYGTPKDFMYFVNYMHEQGIGILLDWVPAHFPKDGCGLGRFDGTAVYEHEDPRKGEHPDWGTYIFNYGRPEVSNFLIANALYWLNEYHIDGIRMDAVASMLYLDYGRKDGEWVANEYGGNGNLEAVAFLRHLNSIIEKRKDGTIVIAEESTAWPYLTRKVEEPEGIGFNYKWNMGWMNDFLDYMKTDPLFRKGKHGELTFSMVYAYSENYILVLSHDEVVHGKCSMIHKMPGDMEQKFANLRVAYGYMMTHPGKKLLFMGQDMAQYKEFDEKTSLDWGVLSQEENAKMQHYYKALNHLYRTEPALFAYDTSEKGFEWINAISANESILVFVRKARKKTDALLVVCNFTPVVHEHYKIGVPYAGKYKEIFNSDSQEFGGSGICNPRMKSSRKAECDDRKNSMKITVPPLGISIFKYKGELEEKQDKISKRGRKKGSK